MHYPLVTATVLAASVLGGGYVIVLAEQDSKQANQQNAARTPDAATLAVLEEVRALRERGESSHAIDRLTRAANDAPRNAALRRSLGNLLVQEGRWRDGFKERNAAYEIDCNAAYDYPAAGPPPSCTPNLAARISGECAALMKSAELDAAGIELIGGARRWLGDEVGARKAFEDLLLTAPKAHGARLEYAAVLIDAGLYDLALEQLGLAEGARPVAECERHSHIAVVYLNKNQILKALESSKRAVAANPRCASSLGVLAESEMRLGSYDVAMTHADAALDLVPHHVGATAAKARSLLHLKRFPEAEKCARDLLVKFSLALSAESTAPLWAVAGEAAAFQGQHRRAIEWLTYAVRYDPSNGVAAYNLGVSCCHASDKPGAEAALAALRRIPDEARAARLCDVIASSF
ncbi:MAG TPA: tetratricopeptide repeat protein [Planctomycetota bacterium]|nr:tetratricopeptide repeat protein [Planctomycetota bacterium]